LADSLDGNGPARLGLPDALVNRGKGSFVFFAGNWNGLLDAGFRGLGHAHMLPLGGYKRQRVDPVAHCVSDTELPEAAVKAARYV